jgi:hypothetical protein
MHLCTFLLAITLGNTFQCLILIYLFLRKPSHVNHTHTHTHVTHLQTDLGANDTWTCGFLAFHIFATTQAFDPVTFLIMDLLCD